MLLQMLSTLRLQQRTLAIAIRNRQMKSVISPPDLAAVLAAQNVTDVLLADLTAPLVTISSEEKALAPTAASSSAP